jgi:signal transduction histidine kinase/ActR/RegA family two-component response regulator
MVPTWEVDRDGNLARACPEVECGEGDISEGRSWSALTSVIHGEIVDRLIRRDVPTGRLPSSTMILRRAPRLSGLAVTITEAISRDGEVVGCRGLIVDLGISGVTLALPVLGDEVLGPLSSHSYLQGLTKLIADVFDLDGVIAGHLAPDGVTVEIQCGWQDGAMVAPFAYDLSDTPCRDVIDRNCLIVPQDVASLYPDDADLRHLGIEGYVGIALWGVDGRVLGILAGVSRRPIANASAVAAGVGWFASRAAIELERALTRKSIDDREQRHRRYQRGLMDLLRGSVGADRLASLGAIMASARRLIGVDRASLWGCDPDSPTVFRCLAMADDDGAYTGSDVVLDALTIPDYLRILADNRLSNVADVRHHPARHEIGPLYLDLFRVTSKLDIAVEIDDGVAGFVCFETRGVGRSFDQSDEAFAIGVADLVALRLTRMQLDVSLHRSSYREALLHEALRVGRVGYWSASKDSYETYWSPEAFEIMGLPPTPGGIIDQRDYFATIHDDDRGPYMALRRAALVRGERYQHEFRVNRPTGDVRWIRVVGVPSRTEDGRLFGLVQDIHEETLARLRDEARRSRFKQQEAAIKQLLAQALTNPNPECVLGLIAELVGEATGALGVQVWREFGGGAFLRRVLRWTSSDGLVPHDLELEVSEVPLVISRLKSDPIYVSNDLINDSNIDHIIRVLGNGYGAQTLILAGFIANQQVTGYISIGFTSPDVEVSAEDRNFIRSLADIAALVVLNGRYLQLLGAIDIASDGVLMEDASGRVHYANQRARDLVGETAGQRMPETLRVAGVTTNCGDLPREIELTDPGGLARTLAVSTAHLPEGGRVTVVRDMTEENARRVERAALERRIQQTGKMEAIGRLAGGVAHDFNNLLGAMMGFTGFLMEDLDPGGREHGYAERIMRSCQRARGLVQQILAFARSAQVERRIIDIRPLLLDAANHLRQILPETTTLELRISDSSLPVLINEEQVGQIVLNLGVNANDAIAGLPGVITLATALVEGAVVASEAVPSPTAGQEARGFVWGEVDPRQRYVAIRVTDGGAGMTADVLARLFEPFFTTKARGSGTGLGLPVVHGIVEQAGGAIRVTSVLDRGSTVELLLPWADGPVEPAPVPGDRREAPIAARVLIVDDEVEVCDAMAIGLDRLGFEPVASTDAVEALGMFRDAPDGFDVLVTDQIMPGMRGIDLIARAKLATPSLVAILCTGYSDGETEESAAAAGVDAFVLKPVEPREVAATIRRLLADRSAHGA